MLVEPEAGTIRHISLTAGVFFGYKPERLRQINVADLFGQPVSDILRKVEGSDYLQIILLDVVLPNGERRTTRAYASHSSERSGALFLSVIEALN